MDPIVAALTDAVGPTNIFTGDDAREYGRDHKGVSTGPVVAAVRPATTDEVAAVIGVCADAGLPVCPVGGNTGLSGGAHPVDGQPSVVVSLSRMRAIESIDTDGAVAVVQAGATIESVQDAARAEGLMFAPDWGARGTASVGGAVSTNAGGVNVLQYGPMRDNVLGLEVVLADGRVWDGLRSLRKDSSGYQLRQLFIGAEGTLGLITRVVVRLVPIPPQDQTAFLALNELESVLPLLSMARGTGAPISGFELLPATGVEQVLEHYGLQRPMEAITDWYVLARLTVGDNDAMSEFLGAALDLGLVVDAVVAGTSEQEANLWRLRDELPPMQLWGWREGYIKYDAAVPVGRVVEFIRGAEAAAAKFDGWTAYPFGHVGDGNIHLHLLPPEDPSVAWAAADRTALEAEVDRLLLDLGGTFSAEHGIGQMLLTQMTDQKLPLEQELVWRIKEALDPNGLLNPGKTLPPR